MVVNMRENNADKTMRDTFGNRMCYYNAHHADNIGMIVCMVVEHTAGYRPMTGNHELSAPWYYAYFETYRDENGKLDMVAMNKVVEDSVNKRNEEIGISREDKNIIIASSMRVSDIDR